MGERASTALADEPVKSIEAKLGLVYVNEKPMALDSFWRNGTAAEAYWLWEKCRTLNADDFKEQGR